MKTDKKFLQAQQAYQQGNNSQALKLCRQIVRATPQHSEAHHLLGVLFVSQGDDAQALEHLQRCLVFNPRDVNATTNLANVYRKVGRLNDAVETYQRSLALQATGHAATMFGLVLQDLGRVDEAVNAYLHALNLEPNNAVIYNNLGSAYRAIRLWDDAIAAFEKALQLKADYGEAMINLGSLYASRANQQSAVILFEQAARLPQLSARLRLSALSLLANNLFALGQYQRAAPIFEEVSRAQPENPEFLIQVAKVNRFLGHDTLALTKCCEVLERFPALVGISNQLTEIVKSLNVASLSADAKEDFCTLLSHLEIDPWEIAPIAWHLLAQCWQDKHWFTSPAKNVLTNENNSLITKEPLLAALLPIAPVCLTSLEVIFTELRRQLLHLVLTDQTNNAETVNSNIVCLLAQQCFLNEYIWTASTTEQKQIADLKESLQIDINESKPIVQLHLALLACYIPLKELLGVEKVSVDESLATVIRLQVIQPKQEQKIIEDLNELTPVDDDVSLAVRSHYEVNPYPRWVKAAPAKPEPLRARIAGLYPHTADVSALAHSENDKPMDVLVAGCGTGRQAMYVATSHSNAQVLAIDMTKASLAYAIRQTKAMGITNIDFAHADILNLGSLDKQFWMIESIGVLHHMRDPALGWAVLAKLLRPGGILRIGLYSPHGRQAIFTTANYVTEHHFEPTIAGMRSARQQIISDAKTESKTSAAFMETLQYLDFYTASNCRDLIFHAQEVCHDLNDIAKILTDNQLNFLGFEPGTIPTDVIADYQKHFKDDPHMVHLGQLAQYEQNNPSAFRGYNFCLQKQS